MLQTTTQLAVLVPACCGRSSREIAACAWAQSHENKKQLASIAGTVSVGLLCISALSTICYPSSLSSPTFSGDVILSCCRMAAQAKTRHQQRGHAVQVRYS